MIEIESFQINSFEIKWFEMILFQIICLYLHPNSKYKQYGHTFRFWKNSRW